VAIRQLAVARLEGASPAVRTWRDQGRAGKLASINAPVPKSTITRAVATGEAQGPGDDDRPSQVANENVPLAVKTQTHASAETRLERDTSP